MKPTLVRNHKEKEKESLTEVVFTNANIDYLAEKIAQSLPFIINKIVQRELAKEL